METRLAEPVETETLSKVEKVIAQGQKWKGKGAAVLWELGAKVRGRKGSPKYDLI